ncbi:DUF3558 family protein [Phytohabitans kaempferiae]|uniref:DUF3558 family protein n=1 Tax=Phytohabitans kaempferiae TaxID=1620943 RepID=A0ABV6MGF7_9ACTN
MRSRPGTTGTVLSPSPTAAAILTAAALLALAGCGGSAPSAAPPATTVATRDTPAPLSPSTSAPSPSEAAGQLSDVDPCALLPEPAVARLGLTDATPKTLGQARVCRWRHEGTTLSDSFTVGVEIFERLGLDDLVATDIRATTVGDRPARSFTGPAGGCGMSLGVGTTARVDTTAVGGDEATACRLAAEMARAVEPSLP